MAEIKDPENTIIIELKDGPMVIELLPETCRADEAACPRQGL